MLKLIMCQHCQIMLEVSVDKQAQQTERAAAAFCHNDNKKGHAVIKVAIGKKYKILGTIGGFYIL